MARSKLFSEVCDITVGRQLGVYLLQIVKHLMISLSGIKKLGCSLVNIRSVNYGDYNNYNNYNNFSPMLEHLIPINYIIDIVMPLHN